MGDAQWSQRVAVVIDDEPDVRAVLSDTLERSGFTVHAAGTGRAGIELVELHSPVVTTLDVTMPDLDGYETAEQIRAVSDTYLLMVTARDEESDMLRGYRSGADSYVTKPFRVRELRARVEAMLRRPRV